MVQALEGWNGRAIMGSTADRSTPRAAAARSTVALDWGSSFTRSSIPKRAK